MKKLKKSRKFESTYIPYLSTFLTKSFRKGSVLMLCTTSTIALYYQYRAFVLLVQNNCTDPELLSKLGNITEALV